MAAGGHRLIDSVAEPAEFCGGEELRRDRHPSRFPLACVAEAIGKIFVVMIPTILFGVIGLNLL